MNVETFSSSFTQASPSVSTTSSLAVRSSSRGRSRLAKVGVALVAALSLGLFATTPALAHDELVGLSPLGSAESGEAPGVQLDFNNEVMDIGSELIGTASDGSSLLDGAAVVEGRSVKQQLVTDLADGDYQIAWRVVSSDGHPIQGLVDVTIDGGHVAHVAVGSAASSSDSEASEHSHEHEADASHDHESEVTTQNGTEQAGGAGAPVGGLIAIGVILVALIVVLSWLNKRRKSARESAGDN